MNRSARERYCKAVVDSVAKSYGVTEIELKGDSRVRVLADARAVIASMLYDPGSYSYPMVARRIGMKNHTSAIHAARRGHKLLAGDPELATDLRMKVVEALKPKK